MQTAGVNFSTLAAHEEIVDLHNVRSNDVHAVLMNYGVEAARATIVSEIRAVFGVYGIAVDERHLGLIADYMTHEGGYKPLNRNGIETACSPLQKMTFETTTHFLTQAAINNDLDRLGSPSSSIVVGKPPRTGTGAFEVRATPPGEQRSPNGTPAAGDAVAAGGAADCEAPAKKREANGEKAANGSQSAKASK